MVLLDLQAMDGERDNERCAHHHSGVSLLLCDDDFGIPGR